MAELLMHISLQAFLLDGDRMDDHRDELNSPEPLRCDSWWSFHIYRSSVIDMTFVSVKRFIWVTNNCIYARLHETQKVDFTVFNHIFTNTIYSFLSRKNYKILKSLAFDNKNAVY